MSRPVVLGGVLAAVVVAAVLLVTRPWESHGGSEGPDFGDAQLVLQDADNRGRPATAEELVAAFPLPIQLPGHVPDGYELAMVTYFQPPPGLSRMTFGNNLLTWYEGPNSTRLSLSQRPSASDDAGTTNVPTEPVVARGARGLYAEFGRAEGARMVTWARCGRHFELESSPLGAVSKDELLRVAESVGPDECN